MSPPRFHSCPVRDRGFINFDYKSSDHFLLGPDLLPERAETAQTTLANPVLPALRALSFSPGSDNIE